jgi:hypothetical protein
MAYRTGLANAEPFTPEQPLIYTLGGRDGAMANPRAA